MGPRQLRSQARSASGAGPPPRTVTRNGERFAPVLVWALACGPSCRCGESSLSVASCHRPARPAPAGCCAAGCRKTPLRPWCTFRDLAPFRVVHGVPVGPLRVFRHSVPSVTRGHQSSRRPCRSTCGLLGSYTWQMVSVSRRDAFPRAAHPPSRVRRRRVTGLAKNVACRRLNSYRCGRSDSAAMGHGARPKASHVAAKRNAKTKNKA